jgi:hypothetical protein
MSSAPIEICCDFDPDFRDADCSQAPQKSTVTDPVPQAGISLWLQLPGDLEAVSAESNRQIEGLNASDLRCESGEINDCLLRKGSFGLQ